ncbi:MAG: hypothetical protein N2443_11635, partial [Blastocatellia bacterium]|nr:hypothetical protein [Blastocatellia bacterium]
VEIGPGDPIKIGYALVIAGPNEALGKDSVRGIEIAVDSFGFTCSSRLRRGDGVKCAEFKPEERNGTELLHLPKRTIAAQR